MGTVCKVCGWHELIVVNTYRHKWHTCVLCGTVRRERKPTYLAERLGPLTKALPRKLQNNLLPNRGVVESGGVEFYNYYDPASANTSDGTKWDSEPQRLKDFMQQHDVTLESKDILDISGGPGFVVKAIQPIARRAVVTEFTAISVAGMARNLDIEAVKYDYASDHLDELFAPQSFDIVLIRYSINFCTDLNQLAREVASITRQIAHVYVSFVPPSLGTMLRWSRDDYTYELLYNPETIARAFAEAGFRKVAIADEGNYPYTNDYGTFRTLISLPYRLKASFQSGINHSLLQRNVILLFEKT